MKKGDHVKTKGGRHGTVHSVHNGPYYGVHIGGALGYFPASHVEPEAEGTGTAANPDPDHDNDNDMPAAAAWKQQMAELIAKVRGPYHA